MAKQQTATDRITLDHFKSLLESGKPVLIVDVRTDIDSKIKGAPHIPGDQIETRLAEIPRDHDRTMMAAPKVGFCHRLWN